MTKPVFQSTSDNIFVHARSISNPSENLKITTSVWGSNRKPLKGSNREFTQYELFFRIRIPLSDKEMELRAEDLVKKTCRVRFEV